MDDAGFGGPVDEADFSALGAEARIAVHAVEACIRLQHVCEVDYTDEKGVHEMLRVRPAFIRMNSARHLVLWAMPVGVDEWRELRVDRMTGARDTGEPFVPSWN